MRRTRRQCGDAGRVVQAGVMECDRVRTGLIMRRRAAILGCAPSRRHRASPSPFTLAGIQTLWFYTHASTVTPFK
ncbi:hypothetical protein PENSPDRAFT_373215 [Peniophora sp. CONT]|nr:hypothetical protein PENSPDRAFT_373215 [Peniophora sp. CONT]